MSNLQKDIAKAIDMAKKITVFKPSYVAMDNNAEWYAYKSKPKLLDGSWVDWDDHCYLFISKRVDYNKDKTLYEIPSEVTSEKKYTIEDIEKCVENWGFGKVEAPYIEDFLNKCSTKWVDNSTQKEKEKEIEARWMEINKKNWVEIDRAVMRKYIKQEEDTPNADTTPVPQYESTPPYNFIDPPHYTDGSMETIDMMVRIWGKQRVADYCEINSFKYRMRMGKKPEQSVERELQKAEWYEAKAKELKSNDTNTYN